MALGPESPPYVELRRIADELDAFNALDRLLQPRSAELRAIADELEHPNPLPPDAAFPTPLRCSLAEPWPVSNQTRRVGWLDQRGRVYLEIPNSLNRPPGVGSFTPLLIELGE